MRWMLPVLWVMTASPASAAVAADSERGARLFETLSCVQCHSLNGKGGTLAPDLGRRIDRDFTPTSLVATMWNHAPEMWAAMRERKIQPGDLNDQAAADLFAYFYSARFFEKPGDAGRGKRLFESKHCADCHGINAAKLPQAKPVAQWEATAQPIALTSAMWNHAATMRAEFASRKLAWPELTSQDLVDILVYLRNLPANRNRTSQLEITAGDGGRALFQSKACASCHTGTLALNPRLRNKTLTDIAVAMWNHAPKMAAAPAQLDPEEMRELVSYLWAEQFFEGAGDPVAGLKVFASKQCGTCHNDVSSGAPKLPRGGWSFNTSTMVSALWHHGGGMLEQMKGRGIAWPRFKSEEMSNLIAYLDSKGGAK